jgi:Prophage antirepressor
MNELQNIDGFNAKIYGTPENPLFLAKDIAELIEHSRASEMLKTVDDDEKLMQPILASGQNRNMWFLTEDGLYEVLMSSKKPQAKIFKKKVKEILKTIRKHGAYMTDSKLEEALLNPDTLINLATQLKQEREAWLGLEKENSQLNLELAAATEKTTYLDLILESPDDILITQIAQDYGFSAVKFNRILNELRIQRKVNKQWVLYSRYMGKGYIGSRTQNYVDSKGQERTSITTTWKQKGRKFLYETLKKHGYLPLVEQDDLAS